jgi:hypothetical protein
LPSRNTHLGRYRRTAHVLSRHGLGYVVGVFFAGTSSTVDLPLRALTALKRHRKRQLEQKLGAGWLLRGLRARLRHRQGDAARCAERRRPAFQAAPQASAMDEVLDEADSEGAPNDEKGAFER